MNHPAKRRADGCLPGGRGGEAKRWKPRLSRMSHPGQGIESGRYGPPSFQLRQTGTAEEASTGFRNGNWKKAPMLPRLRNVVDNPSWIPAGIIEAGWRK